MFGEHKLVPSLRRSSGAPGLAPFETWTLAVAKLRMCIRVCLQAYRNLLKKMIASPPLGQDLSRLRSTEAAALIEFAVALPLLVVLVVGIFDFGGAFNLKQELNNAVREGAHFAATQPSNDLALGIFKPPSVDAVRFLVDSYLQTAKIDDCGLSSVVEPNYGAWPVWVYNANTGCNLTLTITRGQVVQETVGGSTVNMLCTTVTISYPYRWHFNSVIQLLVPGANYTFTDITSDATAVNMN
jgi:Flp pilus assembly protein TadG